MCWEEATARAETPLPCSLADLPLQGQRPRTWLRPNTSSYLPQLQVENELDRERAHTKARMVHSYCPYLSHLQGWAAVTCIPVNGGLSTIYPLPLGQSFTFSPRVGAEVVQLSWLPSG